MEKETKEMKTSIYLGMSIYRTMKDCRIKFDQYLLTMQDKKYLSLYLGLIKSKNRVSERFKTLTMENNIMVNATFLNQDEYARIYMNDFADIVDKVDFESIDNYLEFLASKDIVRLFNQINGISLVKESNKQLIKK